MPQSREIPIRPMSPKRLAIAAVVVGLHIRLRFDIVSLNQYLTLKFAPVKILLGTWAMLSDFVIDSLEVSPCFGIYIERLHTFTFLKTLGLRAPPVA